MKKGLCKKIILASTVMAMTSLPVAASATELSFGLQSSSGNESLNKETYFLGGLIGGILDGITGGGGLQGPQPVPDQPVDTEAPGAPQIRAANYASWMNGDVIGAWDQGFYGQGVTITTVDDFNGRSRFSGNLGDGVKSQLHGEWVEEHAGRIATQSNLKSKDFNSTSSVTLDAGRLNVVNLSFGVMSSAGPNSNIGWSAQERSIINYGQNGDAVIVKAAGNDGVDIGDRNGRFEYDFLNRDLIGGESVIFAGALTSHGTTDSQATIAGYSNRAGDLSGVQERYVMVGVRDDLTGMAGTSFAAPQISAYASVIGSKFTSATPTQVVDQILDTARTDTIRNYAPSVHGRGEASLSRALSPVSLN